MGSKGSSDSGSDATNLYNTMADISKALYEEATPVRQSTMDLTSKIYSGDYSPRSLPTYAPLYSEAKKSTEAQYDNALDTILSSNPRGGQLYSAINDLATDRASAVGSLGSNITSSLVQDIINTGTNAAYGSTGTSTSGLSSAANTAANLSAQENYSDSAKGQGVGQLAGMLGSAWILA